MIDKKMNPKFLKSCELVYIIIESKSIDDQVHSSSIN